MNKKLYFILYLGLFAFYHSATASDDCQSLMRNFLGKSSLELSYKLLKNSWSKSEKKELIEFLKDFKFSSEDTEIIIESLNMQASSSNINEVKNYLRYVLNLNIKNQKTGLMDLAQLNDSLTKSKYIKKFITHEKILQESFVEKRLSPKEKIRFQDLYYGCRAFTPNEVNKNAAKNFKNFNLSLNLGTLATSYAFYNMDKDINTEWFGKLGYDIGMTVLFSYLGSKIQTNTSDNQIVKSLKSYLMGRVVGSTDILVYDPIFNDEQENAEKRIQALKTNPKYKEEIQKLLHDYNNRHLYTKIKTQIVNTLRKLPEGLSLGVRGNSIDSNGIDWNNLKHEDLDREDVQQVLVAAAIAQIYHEKKGALIETGDAGLDRYVFNTFFYGVQIPKSIFQNFITYRILCMGQDNIKLSFTKAVLFNVTMNFIANQILYGYREKAINQ